MVANVKSTPLVRAILTAPFEIRHVRLRKCGGYGRLGLQFKMAARNPMTRIFKYLAVALSVLAGTSAARATMDDDFFNFRGRQQQQQQPMQRGVPYYGPG